MNKRTQNCTLAALALSVTAILPAVGYAADDDDRPEQIDETATELRDYAKEGINAAREAAAKTGKAADERAEAASEAVNGDRD